MTLSAWRITKTKHADTAFTGDGARLNGGRWNSPGIAVVYAAQNISLAMLEMLVHFPSTDLLRSYSLFEVVFDDELVSAVDVRALPSNWTVAPPLLAIQQIGNQWAVDQRSAVLRVPSAIVPHEWNYILNPFHPDFASIKIGNAQPITFDKRLFKETIG